MRFLDKQELQRRTNDSPTNLFLPDQEPQVGIGIEAWVYYATLRRVQERFPRRDLGEGAMTTMFQRRRLLIAATAWVFDVALRSGRSAVAAGGAYADPQAADAWMMAWMQARQPLDTLHVSRFKDPTYFLLKPIGWQPNAGEKSLPKVQVPSGFVTDFASIPRVFWSILRPDGEYTYPAIIHDYLYWSQKTSRATADEIFNGAMIDFKIDPAERQVIYNAVRAGGQSAWDGNSAKKKVGEKRVLKKYPTDPTVTWAEWKKSPSHFENE